eukprot:m.432852 g.432852  ORF g.432852 m.432852 type:complete len:449 (-) comp56756_c2_seq1:266-1612(-)
MQVARCLLLLAALLAVASAQRRRRSASSAADMKARLDLVLDFSDLETANMADATNAATQEITDTAASINAAADAVQAATIAQLDTRTKSLSTLVASVQTNVNALAPSISQTVSLLTAQLSTETAARSTTYATISNAYAALDTAVSSSIVAATADRSTIRAARTTDTILASVSTQLAAATSTEASRAVAETAGQSTAVSSIRPSHSSLTKTALATEATRADTACASVATASATFSAVNRDGSLDHTACTSPGAMYYSTARRVNFVCAEGYYTPFAYTGAFLGTTILSTAQVATMMNILGGAGPNSAWTRCFRMGADGSSSTTWHSKCDGLGQTVILAKATNGYVWGGYNAQGWTSRGGYYITSKRAVMFRFNGNQAEGVYSTNYPENAHYDTSTYGPTWGGGHDWYTPQTMTSASFSPSSYTGPNYSSSFLAGTSSVTVSELEAWYRVG